MSEVTDKSSENDRELRRRFGSGDDKVIFETKPPPKPDSLSPADSENDQRFGTDSDHVRKNFIDFSQFCCWNVTSVLIEFVASTSMKQSEIARHWAELF